VTRRVVFSPEARTDLRQLYLYIAGRSGDARALAYVERIEAFCLGFADFPERGTRRDDLHSGLRTTGFERRVTLAFTAAADTVTILRILYGGRDLERAFDDEADF
jgi:toxin ParE1/3/4